MKTFYDKLKSFITGKNYETNVYKYPGAGLKASIITSDKPENYKEKAILKRRKPRGEKVPMQPFPAAYNGGRAVRTEDGGIIRLKRKNER